MAEIEPTNPLDFPRYVRSIRPELAESLPFYIDDELDKLSVSLQSIEEAVSNNASASIEEERIARVTEDEALALRIVTVEATFDTALTGAVARVRTEELARARADEALASRIVSVEADFTDANSETNALIKREEIARATGDEALAARIDIVQAQFSDSVTSSNARFSSEIYARTTQDEALAYRIDTLSADFQTDVNTLSASITTEQTVRANADFALASQINTVQAQANQNFALIQAETQARVDADEAVALDIMTIAAQVNGNSAVIASEITARSNADSAMASSISSLTATVNSNTAAITNEQTVRATADSALSSSVSTLSTTVNGHTASISTHQSSIDGLNLKYGVALNANGFITGFTQNNNGTTGDFTVVANVFKVTMPGFGAFTPFTVDSGGVHIDGDLIVTGTITAGKIANLSLGPEKIAPSAISVPYTYDGPASTLCSVGSETTILETPFAVDVGDASDGCAVVMFFGEIDSGSEKDMGLQLRLYVSINGGGYSMVGTNKGGMRTSGANSFFDMPVSIMHTVTLAQTLQVKVTAQPYIVDTASDTRAGYIRSPKVAILGAKR